jgi:hypothetical protein
MKRGSIFLFIIISIALKSCSSMKVVEYSIKSVPNIPLSETATTVLLYNVNNISVKDNQTILHIQDSVAQYIYSNLSDKLTLSEDSTIVKEYVVEQPTSQPLKKEIAEKYNCGENNIISLNKVSVNPYYRSGTIDDDWYFIDLIVPTKLHISVSSPKIDSIVSYSCVDTLVFSGAGYTQQEAINSLPSRDECIGKLVTNITKVALLQYQSHQEKYARLYFVSSNRMMRKADKFWKEGKYDEASYLWEYVYENKRSKKIQAKTAANMAMYEEMKHNYDKSLMWARISFALHSRRKSVYDPQIAYLSDYIQQLRLDLKEQQENMKTNTYRFE